MHECTSLLTSTPPSAIARDNPFATCWTRPGALPFRFNNGQSAEQLVAKLAAQQWHGAIVGPHGSGKSTLLEALKPAIVAAGRSIQAISLRDGQRRLPRDFFATLDRSIQHGRHHRRLRTTRLAGTPSPLAPMPFSRRRIARDLTHTGRAFQRSSDSLPTANSSSNSSTICAPKCPQRSLARTSPLAMPAMAATSARFSSISTIATKNGDANRTHFSAAT